MPRRFAAAVAVFATLATLALGSTPASADDPPSTFTTVPTGFVSTPIVGHQSTANTLTWAPQPDSFSYQWSLGGTPIDGATTYKYVVPAEDQGGALSATITAHKAGFADATVTTPAQTVLGQLTYTPASLSGTFTAGNTVTVTNNTWTPGNTSLQYRWYRTYGTEVTAARGQTSYTLTDADTYGVYVTITGRLDGYEPEVETVSTGPVLPDHFITATPTISGTPSVGIPIQADGVARLWNPQPTSISYQWLGDGAPIPGAVGSSYLPQAADVGHHLSVTVTGTKAGWATASATSVATAVVAAGYYTAPPPTITGTAKVGDHLTAHAGTWHPTPEYIGGYDWYVDGVLDTTQGGSTFYPTVAGSRITVASVGGSNAHLQTSPLSKPTDPIAAGSISAPKAEISDYVAVGAHLQATFTGAPYGWASTQAWYLDGHEVSTAKAFTPTAADYHHKLVVAVTLTVPGYAPVTGKSKASTINTGFFEGIPLLTSNPTVGQTVSVDTSMLDPVPTSMSIDWYDGLGHAHGRKHIGSGRSFTVPAKYAGKHIYALIRPQASHIESDVRYTRVAVVAKGPFASAPAPTVTGAATVGATLTASRGTWAPSSGVKYSYQWMSQASVGAVQSPIAKATGTTFAVTPAQVGELITVRVTASLSGYITTARESEPSTAVVVAP